MKCTYCAEHAEALEELRNTFERAISQLSQRAYFQRPSLCAIVDDVTLQMEGCILHYNYLVMLIDFKSCDLPGFSVNLLMTYK